jgi:hypothetical protein
MQTTNEEVMRISVLKFTRGQETWYRLSFSSKDEDGRIVGKFSDPIMKIGGLTDG